MDLPLTLDHLAFCKGRDPPTNFKHLDFFNKHLYFPLEKSFPRLFCNFHKNILLKMVQNQPLFSLKINFLTSDLQCTYSKVNRELSQC